MSLDSKDVNTFVYSLDADDQETLADWIRYFDAKY